MEYQGELTADDLVRAYVLHRRRRPRWRPLVKIYLGLFIAAVIFFQLVPVAPGPVYGFASGVIAVVVASYLWVASACPRRLRRMHAEMRALRVPFQSRIDEAGFQTTTELDSCRRPWAELRTWKEDSNYFLLYEAAEYFRIVPKRLLGGAQQSEELRGLLAANLGAAA